MNSPSALQDLFTATHAGMTQEEFERIVHDWFASATHPKFARPCDQVAFRPQVELLEFLRANGFATFIASGGGGDFMRVISERAYGIARSQVDDEREVAYDRDFKLSPLVEALDKAAEYGITVVSMKRDWKTVFV